jgi:RNA polymerase sigma factor (sigma-70 family)
VSSDALKKLVLAHEPLVRRFFSRKIKEINDLEDLVQDTLCAVLEAYPRFSGRSSVTTWVYGICRNVLYNYYYRNDHSRKLIRRIQSNHADDSPSNLFYLHWARDRLDPAQKKLFNNFYRDAMSIKEISFHYGIPEGTVKYRLYRLRQELKRIFERR